MPQVKISITDPDTGDLLDEFLVSDWHETEEEEGVGAYAAESLLLARIKATLKRRKR
jgi:hypothetical protein